MRAGEKAAGECGKARVIRTPVLTSQRTGVVTHEIDPVIVVVLVGLDVIQLQWQRRCPRRLVGMKTHAGDQRPADPQPQLGVVSDLNDQVSENRIAPCIEAGNYCRGRGRVQEQ